MRKDIVCLSCGVQFRAEAAGSRGKPRRFCSPKCGYDSRTRHGLRFTPEFDAWQHMRARCNRPNHKAYPSYGGRGIKVCDRWDFAPGGFENFYADMGPRPGAEYSIERINNEGDYEPGNCKWATQAEQNANRKNVIPASEMQAIRDGVEKGLNFTQISRLIGRTPSATATKASSKRPRMSRGRRHISRGNSGQRVCNALPHPRHACARMQEDGEMKMRDAANFGLAISAMILPMYFVTAWAFTLWKAISPPLPPGHLASEPWWIAASLSTALWVGICWYLHSIGYSASRQ